MRAPESGPREEPGNRSARAAFAPGTPAGFVWNPRAGGTGKPKPLQWIRAAFAHAGVEVRETPTRAPGHAETLAREHAAAGAPAVFCWGGDGTLAETARGLLDSGTALAPLPGGTMNVLAREIGLPRRAPRAVRALLDGRVITIRPGLVRSVPRPGDGAEPGWPPPDTPGTAPDAGAAEYAGAGAAGGAARPFLSLCSVGLDASVVRRVAERRRGSRRQNGMAPWVRAGLAVFATARLPRLRVRLRPAPGTAPAGDGGAGPDRSSGTAAATVAWVGVGNQRRYARYLRPFPGARLADPYLVATVVRSRTRFAAPLVAAASLPGLAQHLPGVRVCRVAGLSVESDAGSPDCQADGDPVAAGAVEITVGRERLRLLVPAP